MLLRPRPGVRFAIGVVPARFPPSSQAVEYDDDEAENRFADAEAPRGINDMITGDHLADLAVSQSTSPEKVDVDDLIQFSS